MKTETWSVKREIGPRFHGHPAREGFGILMSGPCVEIDQDLEHGPPFNFVRHRTSQQVHHLLVSKGFEEYADAFRTHDILGQDLLHMSRKDVKALGVTLLGPQIRLHREIRRLERL